MLSLSALSSPGWTSSVLRLLISEWRSVAMHLSTNSRIAGCVVGRLVIMRQSCFAITGRTSRRRLRSVSDTSSLERSSMSTCGNSFHATSRSAASNRRCVRWECGSSVAARSTSSPTMSRARLRISPSTSSIPKARGEFPAHFD